MKQVLRRCPLGLGYTGISLVAVLTLLSGIVPQSVLAASETSGGSTAPSKQKFEFAVGGFFPRINSTVSLGPTGGGDGGTIDLEDDLGLNDTSASPWVSFDWHFQPRHNLHVEWFQLNRDGDTTATRTFTIGETEVFAGVSLDSQMDINLGRITYSYSFVQKDKWDLAFNVGAHVVTTKVTATASGLISVDGGPIFDQTNTESTSTLTFPLPHIGGVLEYKFNPKVKGVFQVLLFAIEVGDVRGSLLEVDAQAQYQISKHFGIGGGLKYFKLDVEDSGGQVTDFRFQFLGPAIYGYTSF